MQFSIHRIWLLILKQWTENKQLYILGLLAYAGIMAAAMVFSLMEYSGFGERGQENLLIIGLMGGGFAFTTTILSQLNKKLTGINTLMLPASALEKFVMAVIYSMIAFPVSFLAIAYSVVALGHYVDRYIIGHPNSLYLLKANEKTFYILLAFLVLQSAALFSTVIFKRYVLVKAVLLVMIVFYGSLLINPLVAKAIIKIDSRMPVKAIVNEIYYDNKQNVVDTHVSNEFLWDRLRPDVPFSDVEINNWGVTREMKGVSYTSYQVKITNPYSYIFVGMLIMSIPFLWLITWFRLKEKEL